METIGKTFSEARAKKKVSASEAARATRIKVQLIEAMERDDFDAIAAPAYAKGFIRIYAEYLELEASPLIDQYVAKYLSTPDPSTELLPKEVSTARSRETAAPTSGESVPSWRNRIPPLPRIKRPTIRISPSAVHAVLTGGAILVVLILLGIGVNRCSRSGAPDAEPIEAAPSAAPAPSVRDRALPVIEKVPDPYLP